MATYWVSKTGNNANSGTFTNPWLTIGKAASGTGPGDIIRVRSGLYEERVSPTSGGTISNPITYIAHESGTKIRGFTISNKGYINIVNFEITHIDNTGNYPFQGVTTSNTTGINLYNCWIHHTDVDHIRWHSQNSIIRGNTFSYARYPGYPGWTGGGASLVGSFNQPSTGVLIEYNYFDNCPDFIQPYGKDWRIRNNFQGPSTGTSWHLDFCQNNQEVDNVLIEANFSEHNKSSDNHFQLNQLSGSDRFILRGNICSKSNGGIFWQNCNKNFFYHNTWIANEFGSGFEWNDSKISIINSRFNIARNNIWFNSYRVLQPWSNPYGTGLAWINADYDIAYLNNMSGQPNGQTGNPNLVDSGSDYRLNSPSIAINSGGLIVTGMNSGNNSLTLIVNEAEVFWSGDTISIGDGAVVGISGIDTGTDTIYLNEPRTWNSGDGVFWRGQKDVGAYPYYLTTSGFDISGTISSTGFVYGIALNNSHAIRDVVFYESGIPKLTKSTPPYLYTGTSSSVTANIYPMFASRTLWVTAGTSINSSNSFSMRFLGVPQTFSNRTVIPRVLYVT